MIVQMYNWYKMTFFADGLSIKVYACLCCVFFFSELKRGVSGKQRTRKTKDEQHLLSRDGLYTLLVSLRRLKRQFNFYLSFKHQSG